MAERLQKYLASAGVASRRKCEEFILEGRVTVNGETVTELGTQVTPGDTVYFDGKPVEPEPLKYYLLNKPAGVVSAVSDARSKTVTEFIPAVIAGVRLFPVGRLDRDTTGLIILTNDGLLAHRLMHPSFEVDKVYRAEVQGKLSAAELKKLRDGVRLEDGPTWPAEVKRAGSGHNGGEVIEISIHEGRKRQVRRMLEVVGHPVLQLHRKQYAMLTDAGLKTGRFRALKPIEVKALQELVSGEKE